METSTSMPIGYRFRPTDEELVSHYLNHKLLGNDAIVNNVIADVDFLGSAPWDLPALSKVKSDDKEWFFFTCLDPMKSTKSKTRFNRKTNIKPETETKTKTKDGYWKITGKDREIKTKGTNIVIGIKKTLVFYGNQHEKTNWVMHEYHSFPDNKENIVLCRLMKKIEKETKGLTHSSSHAAASIFGNTATMDSIQYACASPPRLDMEYFFPETPIEEECSIKSLLKPTSLENENGIGHDQPEAFEEDSADDSSFVDSILNDGVSISKETS